MLLPAVSVLLSAVLVLLSVSVYVCCRGGVGEWPTAGVGLISTEGRAAYEYKLSHSYSVSCEIVSQSRRYGRMSRLRPCLLL